MNYKKTYVIKNKKAYLSYYVLNTNTLVLQDRKSKYTTSDELQVEQVYLHDTATRLIEAITSLKDDNVLISREDCQQLVTQLLSVLKSKRKTQLLLKSVPKQVVKA